MKKAFSIHHAIAVMKRQPAHLQHVYAGIFAGTITLLIGAAILYFDYGFWREQYRRSDEIEVVIEEEKNYAVVETKSPGAMFSDFLKEVSEKLETIGTSSVQLLDGKDSYTRE